MYLKAKGVKKGIGLCMAFFLLVTSVPVGQVSVEVWAGQEAALGEAQEVTLASVREEAAASYESDEKLGFDIDFDPKTVTSGIDYSTEYMEVFENLRTGEDDQTVIIRFKTNQADGLLFGVGGNDTGTGQNMILGLKGGGLRFVLRGEDKAGNGSDLNKGTFGSGLADGNYHTVAISFLPSMGLASGNVRVVVDGSSDIYDTSWGAKFKAGFNCLKNTPYTKFEVAGGTYAYADPCNSTAFNGEIDFLTVINKAYDTKELQKLTLQDRTSFQDFSEMYAAGTCQTWLFTGGTEGVADFATDRTTRNWVGLFEDNYRLRVPGFVGRGRFVFNTSKRNMDMEQLLDEYETRVHAFGTRVVGVMVGAADYEKGADGIEAFKETLSELVDTIIYDLKIPLLISPYPALDETDMENVTAYTEAMKEVAGEKIKLVDLSGLETGNVNPDGSLTAAGHQAVANMIKNAVGLGNYVTSYGLNQFADGAYTVAKTTESGELAQVSSVTAGENSIEVEVDASSISSERALLEYELTNADGEMIAASVEEGETEFSVHGLKPGVTYTLFVYDASRGNVRESYKPVQVTVAEGAEGVSMEYEDGNISVNEKIQALLESEEPVTYLFMGDSITHGIITNGYDNVPQMFAKYLDEIGRTDDIVLNTGVSNATLATTLDQIEPRLERYRPDVVMVMLGTNDVSWKGENTVTGAGTASTNEITAEEYGNRYKELVRKIHGTNPDASIVLRVPCDMIVDNEHGNYASAPSDVPPVRKYITYFQTIPTIVEEMEEEIEGLNIMAVNHLEEWQRYSSNVRNDNIAKTGTYCWLVDNVHPNGRGNLSMFQQIIKEIGFYKNTSELANYAYELNEWTGTSDIAVTVTQRAGRASVPMSALSGYTNGLKDVTLTLTADGKRISKKEAYAQDGVITITGLDAAETYEVKVTGRDGENSKEITFAATLTKIDSAEAEATEEEKQELEQKIDEANQADMSAYPDEIADAYYDAVNQAAESVADGMKLEELDAVLAQVRLAMANAQVALKEYEAAKAELSKAVAASKAAYMDKKSDYEKLPGWSGYAKAYGDAQAVSSGTKLAELKGFLSSLKAAEGILAKQKEEADKNPDIKDPNQNTDDPNKNNQNVQEKTLEQGKVYYAGDYGYRILDLSAKTVELAEIKNPGLKKLAVEAEVTLEDQKKYAVTSISVAAFKDYSNKKSVTDITVSADVDKIGDQMFAGYQKLKAVTIQSAKLTQIGKKAFFGCKKLKKLTIKSSVLKKVGKQAFKGTAAKLTITVPKKKLKAYRDKVLKNKGQSRQTKYKKGK